MPNWNHYFTNDEISQLIQDWKSKFPNHLRVEEIGKSFENRPIFVLVLTDFSTGTDLGKPAVWIDANIHATELAGATTALCLAHTLLTQDQELLRHCTYYICPRLNPDGAHLALAKNPIFLRSSTRPYPLTDALPGLHTSDIDGDGRILQMRIPDPAGDWKVSHLDSRLMEKRAPNDLTGQFYRLLPEGHVEEYDGWILKPARPKEGLDLNRNYPYSWRPENEQLGAGPYPTSEPEVRAMVQFISEHKNISTAICYHTYSGAILRPYNDLPDEKMEANDLWVLEKLGKIGTEQTGYPCMSVYHDFRYHPKDVIGGVADDWMFHHFGIFAYTVEIWDIIRQAGIEGRKIIDWFREHPHTDDLKILKWADQQKLTDAYVQWYPFNHPTLGKVELGGWNMLYTWRNPPAKMMGDEARKNVEFAKTLGEILPRLKILALTAKPIADQSYRIELVVENQGFLPTYTSEIGKTRKCASELTVQLSFSPSVKLTTGKARTSLGHLEGRANKLAQSGFSYVASPQDNRVRAEWVVQGKPGETIDVTLSADRGGTISKKIVL